MSTTLTLNGRAVWVFNSDSRVQDSEDHLHIRTSETRVVKMLRSSEVGNLVDLQSTEFISAPIGQTPVFSILIVQEQAQFIQAAVLIGCNDHGLHSHISFVMPHPLLNDRKM